MEDTLGAFHEVLTKRLHGLNPCFNGRYSRRDNAADFADYLRFVLILVLMEDTLGDCGMIKALSFLVMS